MVTLEEEKPLKQETHKREKNFVPPSEAEKKMPDRPTQLLSETDSATPHQQINRGDEGSSSRLTPPFPTSSTALPTKKSTNRQPPHSQSIKTAPKKMALQHQKKTRAILSEQDTKQEINQGSLRLNDGLLEKTLGSSLLPSSQGAEEQNDKESKENSNSRHSQQISGEQNSSDVTREQAFLKYQPPSQLNNSSLPFQRRGTSDFLLNIPEGDITLLNAKADHFAVFVRRVALQVFGSLKRQSWQQLPFQEATKVRDFVIVHVVMSLTGKFLSADIGESSGSVAFDRMLFSATEEGAWDQHPPPGAEALDGNIHFIFQAKIWSQASPNGYGEQRWLLLGTGLQ